MTEPRRRYLRPGELYAVDTRAVRADADRQAFFWLFGPPVYKNERIGSVSVVRISGPLEYHDDMCGDSYERIIDRIRDAFTGQDCANLDEKHPAYNAGPPSHVVLRVDSPGGVVAGLHETIVAIRSMRKRYGIPLCAYADETAYSAGYALTCAADSMYLPASGFCGSIGVISTLVDQSEADKKFGYRFVILTSGARKADGHPHSPITDDMIDEERPRVETLAMQFFQDVRRARGLSIDTIRGFQAKRFLGQEAVDAGVADEVIGFRRLIRNLRDIAKDQQEDLAYSPNRMPT